MPYLCWIYNDDIQNEFIGINTCAVDMLNALPTDKKAETDHAQTDAGFCQQDAPHHAQRILENLDHELPQRVVQSLHHHEPAASLTAA